MYHLIRLHIIVICFNLHLMLSQDSFWIIQTQWILNDQESDLEWALLQTHQLLLSVPVYEYTWENPTTEILTIPILND